jgi:cellobiose phosphorylase
MTAHKTRFRPGAFGAFDDERREFLITRPHTPAPWINYLMGDNLVAFISQQAGGSLFYKSPKAGRITRYDYLGAPSDRPGFYVYIKDHATARLWNPSYGPTCTPLDAYTCAHGPGYTRFDARLNAIRARVGCFSPPDCSALILDVELHNRSRRARTLSATSYFAFGILEPAREADGWCVLRNQVGYAYERDANWIRYRYRVFEAPLSPAMFVTCTRRVDGWDCSRDAFFGPEGSVACPGSLAGGGLTCSQAPNGGHGAGVLGVDVHLPPGGRERFAFVLGVADDWSRAEALRERLAMPEAIDAAWESLRNVWRGRLNSMQVECADKALARTVNTWGPVNAITLASLPASFSTDHTGGNCMRYRDHMQYAMGICGTETDLAAHIVREIYAHQNADGTGCYGFYPHLSLPPRETPFRNDNNVWGVFTVDRLVRETGELAFWDQRVAFRDAPPASVFEHAVRGLRSIHERRGPRGLPRLVGTDWNDSLVIWGDGQAESVMLGMQFVRAAGLLGSHAARLGRHDVESWCTDAADTMTAVLNGPEVWDGHWYRRLLLSEGLRLGSRERPEGRIYLNPQSWAVISGVADDARGRQAMDAAAGHLATPRGLMLLTPPYTGIPTPDDPLTSNSPGIGENGGIFCHANTWAIIAECLLGRADVAMDYYRRILPAAASQAVGQGHWRREPYAFSSWVYGPAAGEDLGRAELGWMTGTAPWMHVAACEYLLGVRPEIDGLRIAPCLPNDWTRLRVRRRFRGCTYDIRAARDAPGAPWRITVDGNPLAGDLFRC